MTGSEVRHHLELRVARERFQRDLLELKGDVTVLAVSSDPRLAEEMRARLQRDVDRVDELIKIAGAGATQPNGEHAKPAPAPPCEQCPHDLYVKSSNANFGYCMNLQHLVVESSNCEREGSCVKESASAT